MATNKTKGHNLKNPHYIAKQMYFVLKDEIRKTDLRTAMTLQPVSDFVLEYFVRTSINNFERLEMVIELHSDYDEVKPLIPYIESIKKLYEETKPKYKLFKK